MQNLIPGMNWGRTLNKKQIGDLVGRMEARQKLKEEKLQKQRDSKVDKDILECTFQPKLMSKYSSASKSPLKNKISNSIYF